MMKWRFTSQLSVVVIILLLGIVGFRSVSAQFFLDTAQWFLRHQRLGTADVIGRMSRLASSPDASNHFALGQLFGALQKYDLAIDEFRRTVSIQPTYPRAHYEIGKLYFRDGIQEGEYQLAIEAFSKEIEISKHPHAYHLRGILYGAMREWEKAEADFRAEMELWDSWGAPLDLSWILFAQGKFDAAEQVMQRVRELYPESVWTHNGFGVVYLNQGRFAEAITELSLAFEEAETLTADEYRYAYAGNDPAEAGEGIEIIRAGIAFNLGVAYEKQKNIRKAIEWYGKSREILLAHTDITMGGGVTPQALQEKIESLSSILD